MDLQKELQRIFEFVVKHNGGSLDWANKDIRNFIRWAMYYKRLFIVWGPASAGTKRIVAVGVAWRSVEPDCSYSTFDAETLETGDWLHVFRVILHPEYRDRGVMFQLLSMALHRYPRVTHAYWQTHARGNTETRTMEIGKMLQALHREVKTEPRREEDVPWQNLRPLEYRT